MLETCINFGKSKLLVKDKRQGGNHNGEFTFGYDVWGKSTLAELISVVVVRTVVTPKLTLAGTAFRSSHKLVNDMNTMNVAGMYTYINQYLNQ